MKTLIITRITEIDVESGEILKEYTISEFKEKEAKVKKAPKVEESVIEEEPIIKLETNKLVLNSVINKMLDSSTGDEVVIQYSDINGKIEPFILSGIEAGIKGNKITKSNTVSFRGKQMQELEVYGTEFELEKIDGKKGYHMKSLNGTMETLTDNDLAEVPAEDLEVSEETLNFDFSF